MGDLKTHFLVFVGVNVTAFLVWLVGTPGTFYWPAALHLGWGAALAAHAVLARRGSSSRRVPSGYKPYRRAKRDLETSAGD